MNSEEFRSTEALHAMIRGLRQNRTPKSRTREYWSKEDNEKLEFLFCEGVGISEIAVDMERTERAIIQKINEAKLFETVNTPRDKGNDGTCYCDRCTVKGRCKECRYGKEESHV